MCTCCVANAKNTNEYRAIPVQFLFIQSLIVGLPLCPHKVCRNVPRVFLSVVCYVHCVTQMRVTIRSFSKVAPTILIHFVWLNEKTLIFYWGVSACVCTFRLDQQVWEMFIAFFPTALKRARKREQWERGERKSDGKEWIKKSLIALCLFVCSVLMLCWLTSWNL